ncbi:MAG: hypothetical protein QF569_18620, partial [Candidatus Poribacteria bacterium]|nr:hypothetical protein [Candidatus Poribacteria bacterium]
MIYTLLFTVYRLLNRFGLLNWARAFIFIYRWPSAFIICCILNRRFGSGGIWLLTLAFIFRIRFLVCAPLFTVYRLLNRWLRSGGIWVLIYTLLFTVYRL